MLKITITETPTEVRCVLQGRLFGPWVSELRSIWRRVARTRNTKHVLEGLKISGKRGLSGMIASIFAALLLSVIVFGPSTRMRSEVGNMNSKRDARTRVNSRSTAHAPKSPTPLFKGKEDQDYASRLPKQDR